MPKLWFWGILSEVQYESILLSASVFPKTQTWSKFSLKSHLLLENFIEIIDKKYHGHHVQIHCSNNSSLPLFCLNIHSHRLQAKCGWLCSFFCVCVCVVVGFFSLYKSSLTHLISAISTYGFPLKGNLFPFK